MSPYDGVGCVLPLGRGIRTCISSLVAVISAATCAASTIPSDPQTQADYIISQISPGSDGLDFEEKKRQEDLCRMGKDIVPGCHYILREYREDPFIISATLALIVGLDCDKSELLPDIRELVSSNDKFMRSDVVRTLGDIGAKDDVDFLIWMLQDEDEGVQETALEALGQMAPADAIPKIKAEVERWKVGMSAEEIADDTRFNRAEKCCQKIRERSRSGEKRTGTRAVRPETLMVGPKLSSLGPRAASSKSLPVSVPPKRSLSPVELGALIALVFMIFVLVCLRWRRRRGDRGHLS